MTMISQYLRAEQFDKSEEAAFYVPGAEDWSDIRCKFAGGRKPSIDGEDQPILDSLKVAVD